MPTNATSDLAARTRAALVESMLGRSNSEGYYWHAEQSTAALLELIRAHSIDRRVVDPMITWTPGRALDGLDDGTGLEQRVYLVLGWTSTSILRSALAERLDSLHPVAAFRLLDQPEIACLDRSNRDYVALRCAGRATESFRPVAGTIAAQDINFWWPARPGDVEGVFAIDIETYRNRFAGTGVAA